MTESTLELSPTASFAATLSALRAEDLPAPVRTLAKQCLLDVLGTTLAGAGEPAAVLARDFLVSETTSGPCTVVGTGMSLPASAAALANGTAGHALDFDDVISTVGHPSVAVAPAALAVAERIGASGAALLTAFAAGVETQARLAEVVGPAHYARGFHTTATLGSFGAAAAAANLLGLDAERTNAALAIAGTQAAGLKAVFGTMSKPLHAGRAAANGVVAAELAARGFTSADDILGDAQGFAVAESGAFDHEVLTAGLGSPWRLRDVRFKVHAACFLTHAAINAIIALSTEHDFAARAVERITVSVPPGHLNVCAIPEPATGLEGKFSLRVTAALVLLHHRATPDLFTDGTVTAAGTVALRDKVTVVPDPSLDGPVATVHIELRDGREFEAFRDMDAPAWHEDPAEQQPGLLAKFHGLADPVLGVAKATRLADTLAAAEELPDVRPLCRLFRP
ncbi:MmgE/PrpD family protein [Amycolatopsis acidicola]|nr:MmgE/PrpD family protein [Amycolatopsis acidicola]